MYGFRNAIPLLAALSSVLLHAAATPVTGKDKVPNEILTAGWEFSGSCYSDGHYGTCYENGGDAAFSCNRTSQCLADGNGCVCEQSGCYCASE